MSGENRYDRTERWVEVSDGRRGNSSDKRRIKEIKKQKKQVRRRRRRRKIMRMAAVLIVLVVSASCVKRILLDNLLNPDSSFSLSQMAAGIGTGGNSTDGGSMKGGGTEHITGADVDKKLKEMAASDPRINDILEHPDQYPEEIRELLANNEETKDFVLDYPEKKDTAPAETISGKGTEWPGDGRIPLLLQWDERWGYGSYGGSTIAVSGCGPTAVAMVAAGLTGDESITPYKVAQYAESNGYYVSGEGTSWSLMSQGAAAFGVQGSELGLDQNLIFSELESGHPIICSMRPGDFTSTGHFIVLTGVEDGKIRVNDPNSRVNSETLWDYDRIEYQISNLWAFQAL